MRPYPVQQRVHRPRSVALEDIIHHLPRAVKVFLRQRHFHHPYLMPLWPLPVVVALLCCLYVLWTILIASSLKDFIIIAGIIGFGLALNHLRGRQTAPLAAPSIEGE